MAAGTKRALVTFQSPVFAPDGQGGTTVAWSSVACVWAEVKTSMAPERWTAGQVMATVTRTVTVWYSTDLAGAQPTWRIVWGSRVLHIQGVENIDERNRELRFLCVEVQGAAA